MFSDFSFRVRPWCLALGWAKDTDLTGPSLFPESGAPNIIRGLMC